MTAKQASSSRPPSTGPPHRKHRPRPNPRGPAHPIRPKRRSRNRRRHHGQEQERQRDDHYYVGGRGEQHVESTSKKNAFDKNDDEYERLFLVEKIVDCKMDKNGMPTTYKTRWMGYCKRGHMGAIRKCWLDGACVSHQLVSSSIIIN